MVIVECSLNLLVANDTLVVEECRAGPGHCYFVLVETWLLVELPQSYVDWGCTESAGKDVRIGFTHVSCFPVPSENLVGAVERGKTMLSDHNHLFGKHFEVNLWRLVFIMLI